MMRTCNIALLALALTGCSSNASEDAKEAAAAANIEAVVEQNETQAAAIGLPRSATPSPAKTAKTLPPAFLGRWGITPADCDFSRTDTKGLVTVFADKLSFYESTAKVASLTPVSQYKVIADLDYTGEGQAWQKRTTLELVTAGTALLRTEQSPATTFRYERC